MISTEEPIKGIGNAKFPFPKDSDVRNLYKDVFGKVESNLVHCFAEIFRRSISDGVYSSGEVLPSPFMVSEYLIKSTKQTERKVELAFDYLSKKHVTIDGDVFSEQVLNKIGTNTYVVL